MNRNLLHSFFNGKSTLEEEKQIRGWIEASETNKKIFNEERVIFDTLILNSHIDLKQVKGSRVTNLWIISTSVAVALLLLVSTLFLLNNNSVAEQFNTIIVPPGQRINLILSDNTNLWLNANTTFRYPTEFAKDNRTVFLDGEAFFEVTENEKKPFIVKTGQGDIHVTGTTFNVEAYSKFNSFETSLFEGGVDICNNESKLVSLLPNQKSVLVDNKLLVSKITDRDEYLWRDGLIAFKSKELGGILLTLEKYFDVDIQILTDKLPQHTYTGKFRQSDGVDYALRVLQRSIRFNYERDEETGTIYIK